jgi:hypothetical protein
MFNTLMMPRLGAAVKRLERLTDTRVGRVTLLAFLPVLGILLNVWAFYPGLLYNDSFWQLAEALSGRYENHHPLIMSYVWHGLLNLTGTRGPEGMLAFHVLLFWSGLAGLGYACVKRNRPLGALLPLVGFFPPVAILLPFIVKDTGHGAALLFGCGALALYLVERRKVWLIPCVAGFFYACSVRFNGAPALFPFVYVIFAADGRQRRLEWARRAASTVGVFGAFFAINLCLVRAVIGGAGVGAKQHVEDQEVFDLSGISTRVGENLFPESLSSRFGVTLDRLKQNYEPGEGSSRLFWIWMRPPYSDSEDAELQRAWELAILDHPGAFLGHRWAVMEKLLAWGEPRPIRIDRIYTSFRAARQDRPDLRVPVRHRNLVESVRVFYWRASVLWIFKPWCWLVVGVAICLFEWRRHREIALPPSASVDWFPGLFALSGILYVLPYFFIAQAGDYRYAWWAIVATSVAVPWSLAALAHRRLRQSGEHPGDVASLNEIAK